MKKQNKKGFTLVELLVVIAILAILATVSVVGYSQFTKKAKESNDNTELHQYATLLQASLVDGEEKVKVNEAEYVVKYDDTNLIEIYSIGTNSSETKVTDFTSTEENKKLLNDIVLAMLGDTNDLIKGSTLTATLTSGKLELTYIHHSDGVKWTFGY